MARARVPLRAVFFKSLLSFTTPVQVSLLRYVSQGSSSLTCFLSVACFHVEACFFTPGVLVARCLAAARQVARSRRKLEAR